MVVTKREPRKEAKEAQNKTVTSKIKQATTKGYRTQTPLHKKQRAQFPSLETDTELGCLRQQSQDEISSGASTSCFDDTSISFGPVEGGESQSFGGRVISVKCGDFTRRIGIKFL
ncbi:hypothetical protein Dsin_026635 [Dipteronia sinensis]|uniref:Uncharacterized protein n=1 Tax=Dipteronia sinensis TaxID=43782 RepID=A0AAD9ZYA3_9ROSI|nr:hypothetical protein Dsin_026635 [Dipteronia sinensis]